MKRSKLWKKKIQNIQFEEKESTRLCNGAKSGGSGDKKFKGNPDAKWNKGSGDLRARS